MPCRPSTFKAFGSHRTSFKLNGGREVYVLMCVRVRARAPALFPQREHFFVRPYPFNKPSLLCGEGVLEPWR